MICPHGPITQYDERFWQVKGTLPRGSLTRNMVIYRLGHEQGSGLLLHSVVALSPSEQKKLESLGEPQVMIVPNRIHRLDASWYKKRYPKIKVLCPKVSYRQVRREVAVTGLCEEVLPSLGVSYLRPKGVGAFEYVYQLRLAQGNALVMSDLLFNHPHARGVDGWLMKTLGSTGHFGMTKIGRWFLLKEKEVFRNWLLDLAKLEDLSLISMAHGEPITSECEKALKEAAYRI